MSEATAETLVLALGIYAVLGLIVGLIYMFGGAGRIDPAAKGKGLPVRVRLLILPGIIGLWPLMLTKLFTQKEPPVS
jgi:hypothetical protein